MNRLARAGLAGWIVALVACGGADATKPPVAANVTLSAVSRVHVDDLNDVINTTVTNTGGAGSYQLKFWSFPLTQVNGSDKVLTSSNIVTVRAGYTEQLQWTIPRQGWAPVEFITAESRDENSAIFRETSRATVY